MELRWDGVDSLADALSMLKTQAQYTPAPQWVRVIGGWTEFQFKERRMPTLEEINLRRARHACFCSPSLRPRLSKRRRTARRGLYKGDAESSER
jgi:hypothetical protein